MRELFGFVLVAAVLTAVDLYDLYHLAAYVGCCLPPALTIVSQRASRLANLSSLSFVASLRITEETDASFIGLTSLTHNSMFISVLNPTPLKECNICFDRGLQIHVTFCYSASNVTYMYFGKSNSMSANEAHPPRLAKEERLAESVVFCFHCHSIASVGDAAALIPVSTRGHRGDAGEAGRAGQRASAPAATRFNQAACPITDSRVLCCNRIPHNEECRLTSDKRTTRA